MRILGLVIALLWGAAAAAPTMAQVDCAPVPGLDSVIAKQRTRVLVFGELHGTREGPALVGDAVCAISAKRAVTFVFEWDTFQEPALLQAYMRSDGGPEARQALLATRFWSELNYDGRRSEAMFGLLERLRALKAAGRPIRVTTMLQHGGPGLSQNYGELRMADGVVQALQIEPTALTVVLVGNFHAPKTEIANNGGIRPAISHLPPDDVISLELDQSGGEAWVCIRGACKAHPIAGAASLPRGIHLYETPRDGFDGAFSTGGRFTASPPAVPGRTR